MSEHSLAPPRGTVPGPRGPACALAVATIAALAAFVLVFTANEQLYDTNFYGLWEAMSLLHGDRLYRELFEWGIPLRAALSAAVQWAVGNRLIGEFVLQWLFIVAGVALAFHLGVRLSRSIAAAFITMGLSLIVLMITPIYHYPHIFFYPLAVWLGWRYLERPSASAAGWLAGVAAIAFLFRHDLGVYLGVAWLLAFGLAPLAGASSWSLRRAIGHVGVATLVVLVVLSPWLVLVQQREGLVEYVRMRSYLYGRFSAASPYQRLFTSPLAVLTRDPLAEIDPEEGVAMQMARRWLPPTDTAQTWLYQVSMLVPAVLLLGAVWDWLGRRWRRQPVPADTYRIAAATTLLLVLENRLLREQSYFVVVAPLVAALAARPVATLLRRQDVFPAAGAGPGSPVWRAVRSTVVVAVLFLTGVASLAFARGQGLFEPIEQMQMVPTAFKRLMASPPVDGYQPRDEALAVTRAAWDAGEVSFGDKAMLIVRYAHDCSRDGDHVLVTGANPMHIAYYVGRPIAGGHQWWHDGWRADPAYEAESLALLQRQSVPFAIATHNGVLAELAAYPRIQAYFRTHYVEIEGANGYLLVDTRRTPTGRFGLLDFPCFR